MIDFYTNRLLHLEAGESFCFVLINLSCGIEKKGIKLEYVAIQIKFVDL